MGSQYIVEVNRMSKFRGDDEDSHQEDGVQLHGERLPDAPGRW